MKPWDIFRQGAGCLAIFLSFVFGVLVGAVVFWIDDLMVQYIDQPTAAGYALKYARELCLRDGHLSTADCNYRHAKMETENKDGWWFVLSTDDGREQGVIADRRGTLEAIAPYGANMPARRAPDRAPAAP